MINNLNFSNPSHEISLQLAKIKLTLIDDELNFSIVILVIFGEGVVDGEGVWVAETVSVGVDTVGFEDVNTLIGLLC